MKTILNRAGTDSQKLERIRIRISDLSMYADAVEAARGCPLVERLYNRLVAIREIVLDQEGL